MDGSDFISFGEVGQKDLFHTRENPQSLSFGEEGNGAKSKEERQAIGRAFRLAAKKEKKKVKSDAKKQRAQNAILHRRLNKNSDKYVKNQDRNRVRDIDAERYKIRLEAVRQAERLAAKHDSSGKSFNVGEVIVLEDGQVKSKASHEAAEAARLAKERGEKPAPLELPKLAPIDGVNSERLGRVQGVAALDGRTKMSQTAQRKLLDILPKAVPPKPIIPAGVEIPDEEENWLALWDINDDAVWKRISKAKSNKKNAAKKLRGQQKEQKKFNKALKARKKLSMNQGLPWDPIKATNEILAEQAAASKSAKTEAEEDSGSDWESSSDLDAEDTEEANSPGGLEAKKSKKSKRPAEEVAEDEPAAKKSKKAKSVSEHGPKSMNRKSKALCEDVKMEDVMEASHVEEVSPPGKKQKKSKSSSKDNKSEREDSTVKKNKKSKTEEPEPEEDSKKAKKSKSVIHNMDEKDAESEIPSSEAPKKEMKRKGKASKGIDLDIITEEGINARVKIEKKRARKFQKEVNKKADDLLIQEELSSRDKKGKRKQSITEDTAFEEPEKKKKKEKKEGIVSAGQWNPEALNGDAERKNKFLRLLGGKKGGSEVKVKSQTTVGEIQHMTSELERQFEKGTVRKNDGGGKRRGLGA